jgi:hypothetical protein
MRVVGNLQVPTKRPTDILQQAKGITLIESTEIRWFSRWSGGGSWSGRAEAQRRPRLSKLRAKRLSDYHSSEAVVEAARRGASGLNKRATLTTYLLKKGELKSSSLLDWKGQKAAHQRKGTTDKKERTLTLNSRCCCRREGWWWCRCRWVRTRHADHKSMWQHVSVWGLSSTSGFK